MDDVLTAGSSAVRRNDAADGAGACALSVRNVSKRIGLSPVGFIFLPVIR